MTWDRPELLWLLLLMPLAGLLFRAAFRRRRAALERFAEARLLAAVAPDRDERRLRWRAVMVLAAFALIVVALGGPRWGFHWEEIHREGIDILIALDTSRSMLTQDVKPNRLERAKLAILDLIKELQGDRVGLIAFAGSAFVQCPLTLDYGAFAESLRAVHVGIIPVGGTDVGEAVSAGIDAFEGRQSKYAALVLMTDGEDHEGGVNEAAQQAAEAGIKVYTVGIGTPGGELIQIEEDGQRTYLKDRNGQVVKSRLGEETLRSIATTTGGAYLYAEGPDLGLDKLYDDYISTMEKRELKTAMEKRFEERYQWPLAFALLLLALEPLVGERRGTRAAVRRLLRGSWRWRSRRRTT
jgi:Ca-activated chloride channel family protein